MLRQEASANGGLRPARATESATRPQETDPDLAAIIAAWPGVPDAVRALVVKMIKAESTGDR